MNWKRTMIKAAINFFREAKNEIAIIYGHDCDSIASASIIFKLIKELGNKPKLFISKYNFEVDENTLEKCKNYEYITIVDIGDTPEERINEFSKDKKVLIVDHHLPKKYKCYYVNPRIYRRNVYMPASYVCWLIYKHFFEDKNILWIAALGTLGDFGAKENKDLFEKIKKVDSKLIGKVEIEDRKLLEKSLLGKITRMVDSWRIFGGIRGVKYVTRLITQSDSYIKILQDRKTKRVFYKIEEEKKKEIARVRKNALHINDFLVYELKCKYNLKSSLASILPKIYKNKIIFIAQKNKDGFFEVSVRRGINRKEDLSKLVEEISEKIKAKGGGHPTAAGMRIENLQDLIEFLNKKTKKKEKLLG